LWGVIRLTLDLRCSVIVVPAGREPLLEKLVFLSQILDLSDHDFVAHNATEAVIRLTLDLRCSVIVVPAGREPLLEKLVFLSQILGFFE
jgi:hypothetical protein